MADFASLYLTRTSPTSPLSLYTTLLAAANLAAPISLAAAVKITRLFRGQYIRTVWTNKRNAGVNIQRVFRGFVGRSAVTTARDLRNNQENEVSARRERLFLLFAHDYYYSFTNPTTTTVSCVQAVYHYHAMIIQRTFRGFYSRRYYHDYSARKAYILSVVAKGE